MCRRWTGGGVGRPLELQRRPPGAAGDKDGVRFANRLRVGGGAEQTKRCGSRNRDKESVGEAVGR